MIRILRRLCLWFLWHTRPTTEFEIKDGYMFITHGRNKGMVRKITGYNKMTGTYLFAPPVHRKEG